MLYLHQHESELSSLQNLAHSRYLKYNILEEAYTQCHIISTFLLIDQKIQSRTQCCLVCATFALYLNVSPLITLEQL